MEMQPFEADEARQVISLLEDKCDRESGLGDLTFRIQTKSGEERVGLIVERDGESSPDGILLNDDADPIRYKDMVWIGVGFAL